MTAGVARKIGAGETSGRDSLALLRRLLDDPDQLEPGLRLLAIGPSRRSDAVLALARDAAGRPVYLCLLPGDPGRGPLRRAVEQARRHGLPAAGGKESRPPRRVGVVVTGSSPGSHAERVAHDLGVRLWRLPREADPDSPAPGDPVEPAPMTDTRPGPFSTSPVTALLDDRAKLPRSTPPFTGPGRLSRAEIVSLLGDDPTGQTRRDGQ
ncbi:MAG: hypothetical protein ACE5IK_00070 [Acidobacteriota bacterium]